MSLAHRVSAASRRRKWGLFMSTVAPTPATTVLDVGFSDTEYSATDNYIEKNYPYPENLTALGIESPLEFAQRYPQVRAVTYQGGRFPFADNEFDVCWSNAVLEHVGDAEAQVCFLREISRVSRRAFFTTPNRLFPVEVHTRTPLLHMLPKPVFDRYLRLAGKEWAAGDYMRLLSERELRALLTQARIVNYRLQKNRLLGLCMDFVVLADCEYVGSD